MGVDEVQLNSYKNEVFMIKIPGDHYEIRFLYYHLSI